MRKFCFLFFTMSSFLLSVPMSAQQQGFVHETSSEYTAPEDPAVIEKLEQWRDLKFGVLIHWGLCIPCRALWSHGLYALKTWTG